jgi:hypothetical protein
MRKLSNLLIFLAVCFWAHSILHAAAPAIQWTTQLNTGAKVFAVDAGTNVYVQDGTNVIELNGDGVPVTTIPLPAPGPLLVKRDSAGNLYYAGTNAGTPVGTKTCYSAANPSFFMGKLSPGGVPAWQTNFGISVCVRGVSLTDIGIDESGNIYAGYGVAGQIVPDAFAYVWKMSPDGSELWNANVNFPYPATSFLPAVLFGPLWSTNGTVSGFGDIGGVLGVVSLFNLADGTSQTISPRPSGSTPSYAAPRGCVGNQFHQLYDVPNGTVNKYDSTGSLLWTKNPAAGACWALAPDAFGGVHVATQNGTLARIDYDGNVAWSMSVTSTCNAMVLDSHGNRFFSLTNGTIARLGDEIVSGPAIIADPSGQTIMAGSNYAFSVTASGSAPLSYYWFKDGTQLPGATQATLALNNVATTQAGNYSVVVSNFVGSVTSAPALLRVKNVGIFAGNQLLTNGTTYVYPAPVTLNIRSAYTDGELFYTLDGSAPTFSSTFYTGPFIVSAPRLVRALGYSADFSTSEEADAANIIVLVNHTITVSSVGAGTVSLTPPGGVYVNTNVVTVTATPNPGWSFMYWLGDAPTNNAVIQVPADRDRALQAVFGTPIATTVTGNGQVQVSPADSMYPYGATVRVTGIPQSGSYFGFWGNAASGNLNPMLFTVTNANPTISSIFGTVGASQSSLTVLITGDGSVLRSPAGNVYSTSQTVILTATPDPG